jgi:small GTP-binding protein
MIPRTASDDLRRAALKRAPKNRFRIGAIGTASTGKSTLLMSFHRDDGGPCKEEVVSTTRLEYYAKKVEVARAPEQLIEIHLVDTMGQEHHRAAVRGMLKHLNAVIFVVDATNPDTLTVVHDDFAKMMAEENPTALFCVAINKADVYVEEAELAKAKKNHARNTGGYRYTTGLGGKKTNLDNIELPRVTKEDVLEQLKPIIPSLQLANVIETSGKYGYNVNALFNTIIAQLMAMEAMKPEREAEKKQINKVVEVLMAIYQDHFYQTYESMKILQAVAIESGITNPDHMLALPTKIHTPPASPRPLHSSGSSSPRTPGNDDSSSSSKSKRRSGKSQQPKTNFETVYIPPALSTVLGVDDKPKELRSDGEYGTNTTYYRNSENETYTSLAPITNKGSIDLGRASMEAPTQTGCAC